MQNHNGYPAGHHFPPGAFAGFSGAFPMQMTAPGLAPGGTMVAAAVAPTAQADSSSPWIEYKTPDGRPYYFNQITKKTVWEKPEDMKPEAELWAEYTTEDGKVYYYNTVTKVTTWTIPPELEKQRKAAAAAAATTSAENASEIPSSTPPPADSRSTSRHAEPPSSITDEESNSNSNLPSEAPLSEPSTTPPLNKQSSKSEPAKSDFDEFKEILMDKKIASNVSWETCLKYVSNEPRFARFRTHPERKTFFNRYKTTRIREENEEQKNKVKRAMEQLEKFLRTSDRMNSAVRYRHACEMFRDTPCWTIVPDTERREIFEEARLEITKKEKEEAKELRKRNMTVLSDILDSMTQITYKTTWSEAQQMLLDNVTFQEDHKLLEMDKEDALIVFEDHIRQLETEEDVEKANAKKIRMRDQRHNREQFIKLLDELHASGKLNSLSKWSTLYHDISADARFDAMLNQPLNGSTPLDLFKFYVEDLKARYEDEKQLIKDILKQANFVMGPNTEFSEFVELLSQDPRSGKLDSGNVKLMHEKLLEREKEREKEKIREENRAKKKLEAVFLSMLERMNPPLDEHSKWEQVRPIIAEEEAFHAIQSEEERINLFHDAIRSLVETCSHHHNHKQTRKHHESSDRNRRKPSSSRRDRKPTSKSSRSRRSRSSSLVSNHSSLSEVSAESRSSSAMSHSSSSSSSVPSIIDSSDEEDGRRSGSGNRGSDYRARDHSSSRHHSSSAAPYSKSSSRSSRQSPPRSSKHRSRDRSLEREAANKRHKAAPDTYSSSSRTKKERSPAQAVALPVSTEAEIEDLEKQRKLLLMQLAEQLN